MVLFYSHVKAMYTMYSLLDINECEMRIDSCDDNATCTNIDGSYDCRCDNGYSGDGFTCASELLALQYCSQFSKHHYSVSH